MTADESVLQVRRATHADLPDILMIYAQPGVDEGAMLSTAEAQRIFDKMQSYPDYRVYVAEQAGVVVGAFALLIMHNLGHLGRPSGVVEDLAVDPSRQGEGLGSRMMRYAMEEYRQAGCYKMALSSNLKRVDAHRFFDGLGFQRHGHSFLVELGGEGPAPNQ